MLRALGLVSRRLICLPPCVNREAARSLRAKKGEAQRHGAEVLWALLARCSADGTHWRGDLRSK